VLHATGNRQQPTSSTQQALSSHFEESRNLQFAQEVSWLLAMRTFACAAAVLALCAHCITAQEHSAAAGKTFASRCLEARCRAHFF
jgi:hypothetical protein